MHIYCRHKGLNRMNTCRYTLLPAITMTEECLMPPRIVSLILSSLLLPSAALATSGDTKKEAPVWNYFGGANHDEGWAELSPDYSLCQYGNRQSPLIIFNTKRSAMPALDTDYRKSPISIEKKDRTFVISFNGGNTITDHDKTYTLKEIRIHTPAEHQVLNAELNPLELHLIHKDKGGNTLIMAIFGQRIGQPHPGLQELLDVIPSVAKKIVKAQFDPSALLPVKTGYYAYTGSLSWPPCIEGVEWRVRKQPIGISRDQLRTLGKLLGRNARLQQPHYFRTVKETLQ